MRSCDIMYVWLIKMIAGYSQGAQGTRVMGRFILVGKMARQSWNRLTGLYTRIWSGKSLTAWNLTTYVRTRLVSTQLTWSQYRTALTRYATTATALTVSMVTSLPQRTLTLEDRVVI